MTPDAFVATSVARRLISRMQATHERRRISVFAGPPGIGKTTAIDAFQGRFRDSVAIVKIARRGAKEVLVLQHVLEALRHLAAMQSFHAPSSIWDLRNSLFCAICAWADAEPGPARKGEYDAEAFGRLTVVFDEAQNLSREAIDALRYWNDPDRCYAPFPLGLIFVGNNEFSLADTGGGTSVISAAVADRALYVHSIGYDEITDEDLKLFARSRNMVDPEAVAALVRSYKTPRAVRSFRRMLDLIDELHALADGGPITTETVREALQLA